MEMIGTIVFGQLSSNGIPLSGPSTVVTPLILALILALFVWTVSATRRWLLLGIDRRSRPTLPSFQEETVTPEQLKKHMEAGGISLRCFVATVADAELRAYVARRNSPKSGKPIWHISVSVGVHGVGLVRWPTSEELRACMLLADEGGQVRFRVFNGELLYLVHLAEVE
jgi:hypothetical protein